MNGNKNRGTARRDDAVWIALLAMLVSLGVSRVALSVSMMVFFAATLLHKRFFWQVRKCFSAPVTAFFTLLFFIPFLSGLWSDDLNKWSDVTRIKLPLLLFPVAAAGDWRLSPKRWAIAAVVFLLTVATGCLWSLAAYAANSTALHKAYLKAKTIPVPLENDHVRFSWVVAVAVIVCVWLLHHIPAIKRKWVVAGLLLFFIVYLHILAARTGLLSLYIFGLLYVAWLLVNRKKKRMAFALALSIVAVPLLAYALLPTLQARLRYAVYDNSFVRKAEYLPGSNDGARTMSLKAGWQLLRNNPLGVGAGDVMHEADGWYQTNVPQVLPTDKFYPSSEWLLYGAFAGWPGVILFTVVMAVPFFAKDVRRNVFWLGLNLIAAASFAFDMGLEVQYGVALYPVVFFCAWKAINVLTEERGGRPVPEVNGPITN